MSSTIVSRKAPRIPSPQELQAAIRAASPGLRVYNPSDQWLNPQVHGRLDIWIPPDLGGAVEPHPTTGAPVVCDGTTIIRGRFLTQRDSSGKVIEGQDAEAAVRYLVDRNSYGQMGLTWLSGENDEEAKESARDLFAEYQRKADEEIVSRRSEFKANWEKNPAKRGEPCPPPTETENAAIERLQTYRRRKSYQFECDHAACPGYASNDWDKFRRHMDVAHGLKVTRERYDETTGGLVAPGGLDEAAKKSGRRKKGE